VQDGLDIDDELLRTLDNRSDSDGLHTLVVTSSSFGMRGFDYRAPTKGITLIIATSFEHHRQAVQGLNRVGRFGDPCKRLILKDIALVDENKERAYQSVLFQYLNKIQKNKVQFKSKEEPKTVTTTTINVPVSATIKSKKG
jgi:hypothetical protein